MAPRNELSQDQIDDFLAHGFTLLKEGFSRDLAEPVLDQVWSLLPPELELRRDDPASWKHPTAKPTSGPVGPEVAALYTPRIRRAFDDLLGAGRWIERGERTGAWPFIFPGFAQGPWRDTSGWHVDGGGQRTLTAPTQALIAIMLFSDITPGAGGTALRVGSHRATARILQDADPEGLTVTQLNQRAAMATADFPVVEAQGQVGDVLLCHGYIVHSASTNLGDQPRIITNNCIALHEPANLNRPDSADYSVYERSLIEACAINA